MLRSPSTQSSCQVSPKGRTYRGLRFLQLFAKIAEPKKYHSVTTLETLKYLQPAAWETPVTFIVINGTCVYTGL